MAYLLSRAPTLSEHIAIVDQIRRAAVSIPANIAEGYALGTTPQFIRCLKIALGSSTELLTHLTLLETLDLVPKTELQPCIELCDRVVAMIIGLIRKLMSR
jgi:four helix bundle protein